MTWDWQCQHQFPEGTTFAGINFSFTFNYNFQNYRKSAYDVFAAGGIQGGMPPQFQQLQQQQRPTDMPDKPSSSRRSSFRVPPSDDFQNEDSPSPDQGPTLLIDDDRRMRRRGSQL